LLVRNDSGLAKLSDLRGRRLIEYSSMRGCLAPLWLDVLLANADLGSAASFFSRVSSANKPIRTVLPVFFHQEDACIVTRRGFDIMGELNPQVMKQMRVLAQSPSYLPHVTTFRASLPPDILERIIQAALAAQETVTGQQMLTMFQSSRIAEIKVEKLNSVRELLADHARLFAKPKNAASRTTKPDTR
jgi:phosphonate transport system substrate-binding protein